MELRLGALLTKTATATSSSSGGHVTDAPEIERVKIGPARNHLYDTMLQMYWDGVRRELPYILLTLRKWRTHREYSSSVLPDEEELYIHGYDTFLDQVSHSSRKFSDRASAKRPQPQTTKRATKEKDKHEIPSYTEALEDRGWDIYSEMQSDTIRHSIKMDLQSKEFQEPDILRRRARMLLQAAQFLDMDKIIEYRPPEARITFWKQPATAQITATSYDEGHMPVFVPRVCDACKGAIRGSMFRNIKTDSFVCEACYREKHYGDVDFTKILKQCCLRKVVSPEHSHMICNCIDVRRRDADGALRDLFPVDNDETNTEKHLNTEGVLGKVRCGLYELGDMLAEAKCASIQGKLGSKTLENERRKRDFERPQRLRNPNAQGPGRGVEPKTKPVVEGKTAEYGSFYGITTKGTEDIPFYLSSVVDEYPYGNVHMALRVGPLIIENGVSNTHGGVLITSRDPPSLQVLRDPAVNIQNSLLLTGRTDRTLYSQQRPRKPKRYKAMMKQVVGGAFCGFLDPQTEEQIVEALLEESERLVDTGIPMNEKNARIDASVNRILLALKNYLVSRVEVFIRSIADRLLDPNVNLRWSLTDNSCQQFCDNIIDRNLFSSLFAPRGPATAPPEPLSPDTPYPLYLMSFVCRPGAYIPERVKSKYDVPNGLTEEYLLKFRYGRHDESDILDSLSEYFFDWGAFGGPIYPYQDLFPWDCTEAFGRYPVTCGGCNIAKHVWAFPFDTWSLVSFHLTKPRNLYPHCGFPADHDEGTPALIHHPVGEKARLRSGVMSDYEWFKNRLTVLLAQDVLLSAAAAMARCAPFRESTLWLHKQELEKNDRLKLGGIHRAQPFSHHYEKGDFQQYFIAGWAHLSRPLQIAEYERLRDWKATRSDVKSRDSDSDSGGGCGAAFFCASSLGGTGAPCSAVEGNIGDTCQSGCVSTCSSCGGGGADGCGGGGCGGCGG
ncbi:hypothetical protein V8F20_012570 [Naviculisporaceae sp. PSN 640]